jgi:predicted nucleic acid-binding protein
MVKALFDTNILIDYLSGIAAAKKELERFPDKAISLITWIEVMVGANHETESVLRGFLNDFICLPIDNLVGEAAVALRRNYKIKLPDAIVWATAQQHNRILITRDIKDFGANEPGILMPYSI